MNDTDAAPGPAPLKGRAVSAAVAAVSLVLLALNHAQVGTGRVSLWLMFLGPMFALLGVGGLVDPRLLFSIGPRGKDFPVAVRVIGGLLAAAGLAISALLLLVVYR